MKVRVAGLKKYFGKTRAVDGISFEFASGQIFGFVGPNGAGKSTTMRILATLDEPTDGDAFLDDLSVVEEPEKTHRLVGYVPDSLPTPCQAGKKRASAVLGTGSTSRRSRARDRRRRERRTSGSPVW